MFHEAQENFKKCYETMILAYWIGEKHIHTKDEVFQKTINSNY